MRVDHTTASTRCSRRAPRTVATACPFGTITLHDGVQDRNAGEKGRPCFNVSELVAKSMKRRRELEVAVPKD